MTNPFPDTVDDYVAVFADPVHWAPVVRPIAAMHGVSASTVVAGEPGTYPTFIVDNAYVVKLFGPMFDGMHSWAAELDVVTMLAQGNGRIPAPEPVASGLVPGQPAWRYIVFQKAPGQSLAVTRTSLDADQLRTVARSLGRIVTNLHALPARSGRVLNAGWSGWTGVIAGQRDGIEERHRAWGTLPERLISQISDFVAGYRVPVAERPVLVHADLHHHHLFGAPDATGQWQAEHVIDWGDARIADRMYELPPLHLGTFHGDTRLLRAFLETAKWPNAGSAGFVRCAMMMTLLHEFNVLEGVSTMVELDVIGSLDQLADALWDTQR